MTQLSRSPESGYSIMEGIEEKTEGAWRPGPGTLYPLLKSLVKEGVARTSGLAPGARTKTYVLTAKGRRELDAIRKQIAGVGRREPALGRLFADLLPGAVFVPLMLRRYRDGGEVFRRKLLELPKAERDSALKELRLLMESQIQWVDSELQK
jgi:DNA-binding PadR family transcriptional regulator